MTQSPTTSSQGMFTRFTLTRVLRTYDLDYANLAVALRTIQVGGAFEHQALAVVNKSQQVNGGRIMQVNILQAVLIGPSLYDEALLANPTVVPYIKEMPRSESFFAPQGNLQLSLATIAPTQKRLSGDFEVDGAGLLTVGVPFVDATFVSSPDVPTSTDGNNGQASYSVMDVVESVSYVTQPVHPTIVIKRQEIQKVEPKLVIANDTVGVLLNPTLAALLGIALPSY